MHKTIKIFISYSHVDVEHLKNLRIHLSGLERKHSIEIWDDSRINPGEEWDEEIKTNLKKSDIFLFLISPEFIASKYIDKVEIRNAINKHNEGDVTIIPILIRYCDFESLSSLNKFQVLPSGAIPITDWKDKDQAWLDVVKGLKKIIDPQDNPASTETDIQQTDESSQSNANTYLSTINRSNQELKFNNLFFNSKENIISLIIYGHNKHEHKLFEERLKTIIYDDQKLNKKKDFFSLRKMPLNAKSFEEFRDDMNYISYRNTVSYKEIKLNELLSNFKNQVVYIKTSLTYEEVLNNKFIIKYFFDYFQDISKPSNTILINVLSITNSKEKNSIMNKVFSFIKKQPEEEIDLLLDQGPFCKIKLPKLNYIKLNHLEEWYYIYEDVLKQETTIDSKSKFEEITKTLFSSKQEIYLSDIRKKLKPLWTSKS